MLRLSDIINVKCTQPKNTYGVNMSRKKMKYLQKKSSKPMAAAQAAMLLLSIVFSGAMTALSGAGLIYNRASYGKSLADTGLFLIISAALMVLGAVLCLFRKNLPNILSLFLSFAGFFLCMAMLKRLTGHADASGWTDKYTLAPVSGMYVRRILPCIIPVLMSGAIAALQLSSYELKEQRRAKKTAKQAEKDAPAPSILDGE